MRLRASRFPGIKTLEEFDFTFQPPHFRARGSLAPLLPQILASLLVATGIVSFVLAKSYSLPSAVGGPAGNAAAVVGAALMAVVAHDPTRAVRGADVTVVLADGAAPGDHDVSACRR